MAIGSLGLPMPATATIGNIIVVGLISDQTITIPATWTSVRAGSIGTFRYSLSRRVLAIGDLGAIFTWILGAATNKVTFFLADLSGATGLDVTSLHTYGGAGTVSPVANSVLTTGLNDIIFAIFLAAGEVDIGAVLPSPDTLLEEDFVRGNISMKLSIWTQAAIGATGDLTSSFDVQTPAAAIQMAVLGLNMQLMSVSTGGLG